jgi:hypothetical protein
MAPVMAMMSAMMSATRWAITSAALMAQAHMEDQVFDHMEFHFLLVVTQSETVLAASSLEMVLVATSVPAEIVAYRSPSRPACCSPALLFALVLALPHH